MAASLKDINRPGLVLVVVAHVIFYLAVLQGMDFGQFSDFLRNYEEYVPAAFLALVVGILNAQIDHKFKARFVFLRWEHPLPASCAFTQLMDEDPRIDPKALRSFVNPLPIDPIEQNRLWFKWYRELQDETAIKQVHREYLFTRDWTSLSLLLAVVLVPYAFYQMASTKALLVLAVFVAEYLLVRRAAKNHGQRFVTSVLAYKSTSEKS